jgi:hypothetical protein
MDKKSGPRASALSRREFGKRVALVTGAAASLQRAGSGSNVIPSPKDPFTQDDQSLRTLSTEGRTRFESMWQNVLRKHGDRLTDDQKVRMRKIIVNNITLLQSVYAVPVQNDDTPATILRLVEDKTSPRSVVPPARSPAGGRQTKRKPARRNK